MDFDLSAFSNLTSASQMSAPNTSLPIHDVLPPPKSNEIPPLTLTPVPDLSAMPLHDVLDLGADPRVLPVPEEMTAPQPQSHVHSRKRRYSEIDALSAAPDNADTTASSNPNPLPSLSLSSRLPTSVNPPTSVSPSNIPLLSVSGAGVGACGGDLLNIDPQVVCQMGGLPYAELCKERAREQYKEAKKNEYLASGNFERMKRIKKNDTSLSEKERYKRRLQMNQDSAAAARHAMDVYVRVLERLVVTSEEEKKSFVMELQQVRVQKDHLTRKVQELHTKVEELQSEDGDGFISIEEQLKPTDPVLAAKLMDMLRMPPTIGVRADQGVRPTPAM